MEKYIPWIIVAVVVLILLWIIATYNKLVKLRNRVKDQDSQIDILLKKRYDLIPKTRSFIKVTLTEGKNREIRKIFSFLGYDVKSLTRIRIGCVELDELNPGEWRNLTQKEIKGLLTGKDNSKAVIRSGDVNSILIVSAGQ